MKLSSFTALGAAILGLAIGPSANAAQITGQVDFAGGAVLDSMSLGTATQVVSWGLVNVATPAGVTAGSILDSTINPGDAVTMAAGSWSFNSGKANLWTVGGFTFNLLTSGIVLQNSNFLNVQGFGLISGNGYDATPGNWYFTSQGGSAENSTFSFSATTTAVPSVPDSGTPILLLGASLTGMGLFVRLRKYLA